MAHFCLSRRQHGLREPCSFEPLASSVRSEESRGVRVLEEKTSADLLISEGVTALLDGVHEDGVAVVGSKGAVAIVVWGSRRGWAKVDDILALPRRRCQHY